MSKISESVNLIILLPLITLVVIGLGGRYIGKYGVSIVGVQCLVVLLILTVNIWFRLYYEGSSLTIEYMNWMMFGRVEINWGLCFDSLSSSMLLVIEIIALCVVVYSIEYMGTDPHFIRFIFLLLNFVLFMIILVSAGTLVQLLIGWEGVGLISFLLVNFWFTRLEANRSAAKAMIFNKVGDIGLVGACCMYVYLFKTTDFSLIYILDNNPTSEQLIVDMGLSSQLELFSVFILIAAVGKSAQLGLHAWLPDAMEGPTPVSALLHSATMVTAGIFLLLRFAPVLYFVPMVMQYIAVLGGLTAFIGGLFAFFQMDLKKIIAYSTCSQLGFMLAAYGMYNPLGCFYHLITHAFFKALLFLSAGSIIHSVENEQDIRRMGGLLKFLPLTFVCMSIGFSGLVGFPFFSGYYSKDCILFYAYVSNSTLPNVIVNILLICSSILTLSYSVKILYRVFLIKDCSILRPLLPGVSDASSYINVALVVLALLTIGSGYLVKGFFINQSVLFFLGFRSGVFNNYIEEPFLILEIEMVPLFFKLLFIGCILVVFCIYEKFFRAAVSFYEFYWRFFYKQNTRRYVDAIYKTMFLKTLYIRISELTYWAGYHWFLERLDRGLFEKIGSAGLVETLYNISLKVVYMHSESTFFIGSLFNFWACIYVTLLIYIKTLVVSQTAVACVNTLLFCGVLNYCELVWELSSSRRAIEE